MMKYWAFLSTIMVLALACLMPLPVLAEGHAHIIVTAQGFCTYPQAPTNLVVTMTSSMCFNFSWSKGLNANESLFTICEDIEPADCTVPNVSDLDDGCYLLYNGSGTSTSYCGIDTDDHEYYITGWGHDGIGNYSVHCARATIEGGEMVTAIYWGIAVLVASLFTIIAFWRKLTWVFYVAGIGWVILGIFSMALYDTATLGWAFGWLYLAVGLVCISAGVWFREKPEPEEDGRVVRYQRRQAKIDALKKSY